MWKYALFNMNRYQYVDFKSWELTLQKIAIWLSKNWQKLDIFKNKNSQKFSFFFKKIAIGIFGNFFNYKMSSFWQFLAIFGHSNVNFAAGQVWTVTDHLWVWGRGWEEEEAAAQTSVVLRTDCRHSLTPGHSAPEAGSTMGHHHAHICGSSTNFM